MPHRRSSSPSPLLSLPLLIIILPIILLLFLFLALPPFLSFTSQLLRPTSVKKSWDSVNIFFVLFAILCGVFAKRNDEDLAASSEEVESIRVRGIGYEKTVERVDGSVSRQWYGFSENKIYDSPPVVRFQSPVTGVSRLRRSSSSYPDLRQESLWETENERYRFRFFDDFEIDRFRSPEMEQIPVDNRAQQENVEEKVEEEVHVKEIEVDTVEISSSSPLPPQPAPKSPTPPPTPPPPPAATRPKSRRTYRTVPRREKLESVEVDDNDITSNPSPPRSPLPPPPPPAPSVQAEPEHKRGRNQRRKSHVKREIAIMWASLSNQKKRKRKQRTTTKIDHIHNEDNISVRQPPPPPPPPPPPSVFHSWFKKGAGKNKKIHSVSTPPPPAPPPPPPLTSSKRWSYSFRKPKIPPPPPPPPPPAAEPRRHRNTGRPPLPTTTNTFNNDTLRNSGNQSPLIPIPPPPPPPPFKIPAMKFTVRGDFVKIRSTNSSRCGSPEPEEDPRDPKPKDDPPEMEMGGTISCPSPDVNVKAATFIARLRGEWKLEKINSIKEKQNLGLYGPGPMVGPSPTCNEENKIL